MTDTEAAPKIWRGRFFEHFDIADVFHSRLDRMMTEVDNIWFTCLTMNTNQIHYNTAYASATRFERPLVNSGLTLGVICGLSVPDTSENGTANLAWTDIKLPNSVSAGDTLYAESEVLALRQSSSRPERRHRLAADSRRQPGWRRRDRVPAYLHVLSTGGSRGSRQVPRGERRVDRRGLHLTTASEDNDGQ